MIDKRKNTAAAKRVSWSNVLEPEIHNFFNSIYYWSNLSYKQVFFTKFGGKQFLEFLKNFWYSELYELSRNVSRVTEPISASLRLDNTTLNKEMSQRWLGVDNIVYNLINPKLESHNSCSKGEQVSAQPIDQSPQGVLQ